MGTLFQSLYMTADAIIIGRFAGKQALAAIESVSTLTKMPINFFAGLASFKLGLPIGTQSALYPLSNTIVQTSINDIGVDSIAAWAVCGKLDFLIWAISDVFCVSVSTFVAQNYGAQKYERARRGVRVGLIMALTSIAVVSCILYFHSGVFAQFLIDKEFFKVRQSA